MPLSDGTFKVSNEKFWRKNFTNYTSYWTTDQTGTGMTVTQNASGQLVITSGTTTNQETIVKSVETFTLPFRVQFAEMQSQRIVNQEFYLGVVDAAGTTYAEWLFDGTTTTLAKTTHAVAGISNPASPTGTVTVAASSPTTPVIREIEVQPDQVLFHDRTVDSSAAGSNRVVKTRTTLDPAGAYYVRIRVKNLGVAPATTTTYTVENVTVEQQNAEAVEVVGGRGQNTLSQAIPVSVAQSATITTTSTATSLAASTTATGLSTARFDALLATAQTVKASAGKFHSAVIYNPNASMAAVHFYNATAPTVGTTTPLFTVPVPAATTVHLAPGADIGVTFSTALTAAATTTATTAGAVAPGTALSVSAFYV
jgi:hypothetical protein